MTKKHLLLLLIVLLPVALFSQQPTPAFAAVDSFVSTVAYRNSLVDLTHKLTNPYPDQLRKARAIFKWITENIEYDYKYYNKYFYKGKEPKTFRCKNEQQCEAKRVVWEAAYIDKILRRKKAVCQGYAMLFKKMCDLAGLRSEYIVGYIRTEPYQVGTAGTLDHAWNAVWIDSAYHLLDATWASGGCTKNDDDKLLRFQKNYNDYYWLTPAAAFAKNHYPKNSQWSLLPQYTKDSFATNPYYQPGEIQNLQLITPASGIIHAQKGDSIRFTIAYNGRFKDLQINTNIFRNPDIWVYDETRKRKKQRRLDTLALKRQQYISYHRTGNVYAFDYVITDNALYYIDILFDRKRMLRYKVIIDNN